MPPPNQNLPTIKFKLRQALEEDRAWDDITSKSFIPNGAICRAYLVFKGKRGILCGGKIFQEVFKAFDPRIRVRLFAQEGAQIKKGQITAEILGNGRSILAAERTSLNFLCHLTAIATKVHEYVQLAKKHGAKFEISATRKTHPGLRDLEKYAVRVGGGSPHRRDLSQMVLLKDNHLAVIRNAFKKYWLKHLSAQVKRLQSKGAVCEIEAQNIREVKEVLSVKSDWVMLDNMRLADMKKAIHLIRRGSPNTKIEVSGGISKDDMAQLACLDIDRVSLGSLTHSSSFADFSLEVTHAL